MRSCSYDAQATGRWLLIASVVSIVWIMYFSECCLMLVAILSVLILGNVTK